MAREEECLAQMRLVKLMRHFSGGRTSSCGKVLAVIPTVATMRIEDHPMMML